MFLFGIVYLLCYFVESSSTILPSTGECQLIENCPALSKLLEERSGDYGHLLLLNILHCESEDNGIYSRCPSSENVKQFLEKVQLLPSQETCGRQKLGDKIAHGTDTDIDEFPWSALLRYKNSKSHLVYGCNGNLISKRYVITAAHCVDPKRTKSMNLSLLSVVLAEYHILNETDCYKNKCTDGTTEILVEKYLIHPEYNLAAGTADIALIRMNQDAIMSNYIQPICLPPIDLIISLNDSLWIAGWGQDAFLNMNKVKTKAVFKKLEDKGCFNINYKLTEKHICAGSNNKSKSCPGDSGGPLMILRPVNENFHYFIAGVLSSAPFCSSDVKFTIFSAVSPYLQWIVESLH